MVNTARGPILDVDALGRCCAKGHLAGAGLDVLPDEPPAEPVPTAAGLSRPRALAAIGRLVITPHAAFHSPEAWRDIRIKSAETMRAAAARADRPQNVITPEME